ncbi:translation initiation factor IF-6 [Candidatus Woesearchaeota archaeon]|nr:translation initiation factor IF-6 [Candidatus Woesearchaeota archaeon]
MHIFVTNILGNPQVGLYGFANDHFCLVGKDLPEAQAKKIEEALHVPVYQITLCGTSLIGVFCAGNNNRIVLPDLLFDDEREELDRHRIPYTIIKTKLTAMGNNILCNDHGAIVNPEYSADVKKLIRKALNVRVVPGTIADHPTVGSCGVENNNAAFLHKEITEEELQLVEDVLGVPCETGTVNLSSPYTGAGVLCNSFGMVIGDHSGGPEITYVDDALQFRKKDGEEE